MRYFNTDKEDVLELRAHHLLCAVCAANGAENVPCGREVTDTIREAIRSDPYVQLKLTADMNLARAHYLDIETQNQEKLPEDFFARKDDYVNRTKDLEVLCALDIRPNTVHPALDVVRLLFLRIESLKGICYDDDHPQPDSPWKECKYARQDYFKQTRDKGGDRCFSLVDCWNQGEDLLGCGPYSLLPIRTKEEMRKAKEESCKRIEQADRLYIRPHHMMCLMCHFGASGFDNRLDVDNLHEILVKMRDNPDIPITLSEGCCMICDPCSAYEPERHMCIWIYTRDQLKDLRVLKKLGLKPGDTLPARDLLKLLKERIKTAGEVCGKEVCVSGSYVWSPCGSSESGNYEKALDKGVIKD